MEQPRTRIAPTPSGFLHAGNAVNFLLVDRLAAQVGARLVLRIDDLDPARYRPSYADDIFAVLDWLGIQPDEGPSSTGELQAHHSLALRREHYRSELDAAIARGLPAYACGCSRRDIAIGRPCACASAALPYEAGRTALRLQVAPGTVVELGGEAIDVGAALGDFVLWRRDDQPAYHLASVIEDRDRRITHIVRGTDLLPSTAGQVYLSRWLDADAFARIRFVHHPLLLDASGAKLSKSTPGAGPMPRDGRARDALQSEADRLWADLALPSTGVDEVS